MAARGFLKEDNFLATLLRFQSGVTNILGSFFPGVFWVPVVGDELPALVDMVVTSWGLGCIWA